MGILSDWAETAKSIIRNPNKFYSRLKPRHYKQPWKFYAVSVTLSTILGSILTMLVFPEMMIYEAFALPFTILAALVGVFIGAGIIHLFLSMVGGKADYRSTFNVVCYNSYPMVLSWIPFVSLFAYVYQIYLDVVGFSHIHKISRLRAFVGVFVLPLLIVALVIAGFYYLGYDVASLANGTSAI